MTKYLFFFSNFYRNDGGYGTENMIYNDLSFTLSHQRVEEYINSLPIETDMKEKMYQNILKGSLRSDKVNCCFKSVNYR